MIRVNGLGQAMAFFRSKGNQDGYNHIYHILAQWLTGEQGPLAGERDVLQALTEYDRGVYMVAQTEALLMMTWVKQFASAFMDEGRKKSGKALKDEQAADDASSGDGIEDGKG